jgi:thiamine biosynthesis protein ThiS
MKANGSMVQVTVNGEARAFDVALSLAELLAALDIDPRRCAIERNLEIAPKSIWGAARIADGDRIEIVAFVGGG